MIINADSLEHLKTMPDNSIDAVVTDPPYGLGKEPNAVDVLRDWLDHDYHELKSKKGFMGKEWDAFVPQPALWKEVLRVLKPGGHALVFSGTRTIDWMGMSLRLAGFEVRDELMWMYGCLSDDTEILTLEHGFCHYHKIQVGNHALAYNADSDAYEWQKIEEVCEYDYKDTAYKIQSNYTDQIVSRNHRCIVERGGEKVFQYAETLESEVSIPSLENLSSMLESVPMPESVSGSKKQNLLKKLSKQIDKRESSNRQEPCEKEPEYNLRQMPNANIQNTIKDESSEREVLLSELSQQSISTARWKKLSTPKVWRGESRLEGWGNFTEQGKGKLQTIFNKVCSLPERVFTNGEEGRLCYGTSFSNSEGNRALFDTNRGGSSHRPQSRKQLVRESNAIQNELRTQTLRGSRNTRTDLATVTPIEYEGVVWCVKVPTGAFVARRNGMVFPTGNSGFPKSMNLGKSIDKKFGAEREVVGDKVFADGSKARKTQNLGGTVFGDDVSRDTNLSITAPATDEAKKWDGWATSLKPAHEPILLVRKPFKGSTTNNVLEHGTGGLNIEDCRVPTEDKYVINTFDDGAKPFGDAVGEDFTSRTETKGRWPANVIIDGTDCITDCFPEDKEKYFYCAKPSKKEKGVACAHPTVKPIALMKHLIQLVTPKDGVVLDPFAGSGTTGVAAKELGYKFILIEREEEYIPIIEGRLK